MVKSVLNGDVLDVNIKRFQEMSKGSKQLGCYTFNIDTQYVREIPSEIRYSLH